MPYTDPAKEAARQRLKQKRTHARWKTEKRCMDCGGQRSAGTVRCAKHRAAHVIYRATYRERLRQKVFDHYGRTCTRCGTSEALSVHHINNDGKEQRALGQSGAGSDFYRRIIKTWPTDIEIVCLPCHVRIPNRHWKIGIEDAWYIRAHYFAGIFTRAELAKKYGVHYQTIWTITTTTSPAARKT